jgi:excisionase family DNA binding protein
MDEIGPSSPHIDLPFDIFDDPQACAYLHIESRTLRLWRHERGLPHMKITSKVILYRRSDLDKWLNKHRIAVTQ